MLRLSWRGPRSGTAAASRRMGPRIHIAGSELAELTSIEPLQMHVRHQRPHDSERRRRVDAGAREVDRIEVHPDIGAIRGGEDVTADLRNERRAVVVLEYQQRIGVAIGQPPEVVDDHRCGRVIVGRAGQTSEEQPEGAGSQPASELHLATD